MLRLRFVIGIFMAILSFNAEGQDYVPGSFVLKSGKVINCLIKSHQPEYFLWHTNYKYRLSPKEKPLIMNRDSIQEMKVNKELFQSINISSDSTKVIKDLLWVLEDGAIKYYNGSGGTTMAVPTPNGQMVGGTRTIVSYIKKGNEPLWNFNLFAFRKEMKEFLKDDPELAAKIGTNGYYVSNIRKIIREYNERHPLK